MPKLSACVITKNEENNIIKWLECMSKIADEMIVVDTGSTDLTCKRAEEYGAKVHKIKWNEDFSAAKNKAISIATGDWIIFLDADEYFSESSIQNLKKYISLLDSNTEIDALICKIINIDKDNGNKFISSFYNLRIFRNNIGLQYENKVHEMLKKKGKSSMNIYQLGNDVEVYHTGYSKNVIKRKLERNLKIILDEINSTGEQPWHYGFLCDCYYGLGDYDNAIRYARLAIDSGVKLVGQENNVYRRLIDSLKFQKNDNELRKVVNNVIEIFPNSPDFLVDKAFLLLKDKQYIKAEEYLHKALNSQKNNDNLLTNNFCGLEFLVYLYLGEIELLKNNKNKAIEYFFESLQKNKYSELSLIKLYKAIKHNNSEDIIDFLNSIYSHEEMDLIFICNCVKQIKIDKVYIYYSYILQNKYKNYEFEKEKISTLMATGKYENMEEIIKDNIDDSCQLFGAYLTKNKEYKENYIKIFPQRYVDILLLNKLSSHKNIFEIKNDIKALVGEKFMNSKLVTIIIVSSSTEHLKKCISNIERFTSNIDYEIIIIKSYKDDKSQYQEVYIENCLAESYNKAIKMAKGSYIILLDDDAIVTENWLNKMMEKFSNNNIGAVGVVSNKLAGQTLWTDYKTEDELYSFAKVVEYENKNNSKKVLSLNGACLLIPKHVLETVGYIDDNIEQEALWDDLSCSIISNNLHLILDMSTFIHFEGMPRSRKSYSTFVNKWGFDFFYSNGSRKDLISLVDISKENINVLEIGCACGGTLLEISNINSTANLYGLEINENSAKIAKKFANVSKANIEKADLPYEKKYFDLIIFGDVLEHLYDPKKVLVNIHEYLADDGVILASLPNVQHWTIIEDLLKGNWTYQDSGILDKTHLRFFTKKEITKMFNSAGYDIKQYVGNDVGITEEGKSLINKLLNSSIIPKADDFMAYQWFVEAFKKDKFTEEEINNLVYMIRRIDNNINRDDNINAIIENYIEKEFNLDKFVDLIDTSIMKSDELIIAVAIALFQKDKIKDCVQLLIKGYKKYSKNVNIIYTLAYMLKASGDSVSALKLLKNVDVLDDNIIKLKVELENESK